MKVVDKKEAWSRVRRKAKDKCWTRRIKFAHYGAVWWFSVLDRPPTERIALTKYVIWFEEMEDLYGE